ncbi:hypothetical protein [Pseudomonas viridiflava]|uniref:hypothetical protein n=1 Tax=Pseudomonas viridiflava TaxID=33069 RepID=UPI000F023974|nr:hypothetical protein [Pseudomonas viridiflava]
MIDLEKAQIFDEVVERWRKIVVPFFTRERKSQTGVNVFGSGFMAVYKGVYFLVTAKHVVDDAIRYGTCAINVNDRVLLLKNISFFTDSDNDLAFAIIGDALSKNKVETILAINLTKEGKVSESFGYHLLLGYPASKNRLDPRWKRVNRMLYSFTAEANVAKKTLIKTVADPIVFDYDSKKQIDSFLKPAGQAPDLYGMSGGPALEVSFSGNDEDGYSFYVTLSGVLVEWHQNKRAIVAASNSSLINALEATVSKYIKNPHVGD